ncbi:DUF7521 family protein [Halocatena halophila]|uniref:DUF7521 family protein n=1 Tax=Halocatena halophila TaxID=2814576 RepID=UPI002ED2F748
MSGPTETMLMAAYAAVVGIVGLYVAWLAYRGYRRNESRPMGVLSLAIALLTAVPVVVQYGLDWLTPATPAIILLAVTLAHLGGVLAILYALTRA